MTNSLFKFGAGNEKPNFISSASGGLSLRFAVFVIFFHSFDVSEFCLNIFLFFAKSFSC